MLLSINNDGEEDSCDDAEEFDTVTIVAVIIEVIFG